MIARRNLSFRQLNIVSALFLTMLRNQIYLNAGTLTIMFMLRNHSEFFVVVLNITQFIQVPG